MDAQQNDDEIDHAHDVFISYAHLDARHDITDVRALAEWLESEGYDVWWDRSLLRGDVQKQLVRKASKANSVIALWSANADRSKYVFVECVLAAANETLIPLIINEQPLPSEWTHLFYIKLTDLKAQKAEILSRLPPPSGKRSLISVPEDARISLTGLPTGATTFIGREDELAKLHQAWASSAPSADPRQKTNVFVLHAIGGAGKSALTRQFLEGLADKQFEGASKVYAWSAYSQGSCGNRSVSADEFIGKALAFFGHELARYPIQDTVERGRKLAHLVNCQRALLILDGLEPLQDAPHINGGRLKDRGLAALITGLAASNKGLLLITSRQELPELGGGHEPRIIFEALDKLGAIEGVRLLAALGVHGKRRDMEHALEEVLGHALSLNLLGTYLSTVHGGDVNQRDQFRLGEIEDAEADFVGDATARYAKRAARIVEGTIDSLGEAETSILHMVGLFDRPAECEALDVLLTAAIAGLTDPFHGLTAVDRKARWNVAVERLRKLKLLSREDGHQPGTLDTHPIVRAHFGNRLKACMPKAYREAHSRLYDYYRYQCLPQVLRTPEAYGVLAFIVAHPPKFRLSFQNQIVAKKWNESWLPVIPPSLVASNWPTIQEAAKLIDTAAFDDALKVFLAGSLDGMRPCFAAITHGCAAGRHQEAYSEVYYPRVLRGSEKFIVHKLGALNADLAALAPFFDTLWGAPAAVLRHTDKGRVLNYAAFALRALGRLREAVEPSEACQEVVVNARDWEAAATNAGNVSELRLTLGDIAEATGTARDSVAHADVSNNGFLRVSMRTTLADALHQGGEAREALAAFAEAEGMNAKRRPDLPKLYGLPSCRYCDLLIAMGQPQAVIERASYALRAYQEHNLDVPFVVALDNLTLGRAHAELRPPFASAERTAQAQTLFDAAIDGLRRAGDEEYVARGLLARAAYRRSHRAFRDADADLAEAHEITSRGEMRLLLTDWHLEFARLALIQFAATGGVAHRAQAETHHADATKLIAATGYKRRLPELTAIRACLDGTIPARILAPDRDVEGHPIWHNLRPPSPAA